MRNWLSMTGICTIIVCSLIAPPPLSSTSTVFGQAFPPDEPFNGLRINYDISGVALDAPEDREGFTTTRSYTGVAQPGTMKVEGSGSTEGGWEATLSVRLSGGGEQVEEEWTFEAPGSKDFSFSVPVPEEGGASFRIQLTGRFSLAGAGSPRTTRGLRVSGSFKSGSAAPSEPGDYDPPPPTEEATISQEEAREQLLREYSAIERGPHLLGPTVNLLSIVNSSYADYVCGAWQSRVLDTLHRLQWGSPSQRAIFDHYDYAPFQSALGGHQFVVIWEKGTDWRETGTVLDPWVRQRPRTYTIREHREAMGALGFGYRPSELYEGQYPATGGDSYPGPEWEEEFPEEHRQILKRMTPEQRQDYFSYTHPQDRQQFIDALPRRFTESTAVAVHSPVRMLISDSEGRRVGWTGQTTFVHEIPGAEIGPIPEDDQGQGMVARLPLDDYKVEITGTAEGSFGYTRALPDSVTANTLLHKDQVSIEPGQKFTYNLSRERPDGDLTGPDGLTKQLTPLTTAELGSMETAPGMEAGQPADVPPATGDTGGLQVGTGAEDGRVIGAADHFERTDSVTGVATYEDLPDDTTAVAVWTLNGDELTRGERAIGGTGWVSFSIATQEGDDLPPGRYTLTITAGDRRLGRKTFTIGAERRGEAAPTAATDQGATERAPATPTAQLAITDPAENESISANQRIRGTAPPGSRVRVTVRYWYRVLVEGYARLHEKELTADDAGNWATEELDMRPPLSGMSRSYRIKVEQLADDGAVAQEQQIEVEGK